MAQQAVETSSEQSKKQQSVTPEASRDAEIERVGLQDTLKNFRQSGEQGVWNTQAEASILDTVRRAEMTQTGVEALNASLSVHINNLNNMQNGMTMQEMSKLQDMADRTKALQTNILSEYEQSRAAIMEPSVVQNSGTKQTGVEGTDGIQQQQPAAPVINITTPLSVVNQYGMPAVVEKVQGIVGDRAVVGEKEIEAALKNCAVDALTAMGRVTEINALGSLLADVILTQASPEVGLDYELAAGLGKDGKQIMLKDVRKHGRGLEYALAQELEKLKLSAEGVIGILKKSDEETLHLINIRGVKDGVVLRLDRKSVV